MVEDLRDWFDLPHVNIVMQSRILRTLRDVPIMRRRSTSSLSEQSKSLNESHKSSPKNVILGYIDVRTLERRQNRYDLHHASE